MRKNLSLILAGTVVLTGLTFSYLERDIPKVKISCNPNVLSPDKYWECEVRNFEIRNNGWTLKNTTDIYGISVTRLERKNWFERLNNVY